MYPLPIENEWSGSSRQYINFKPSFPSPINNLYLLCHKAGRLLSTLFYEWRKEKVKNVSQRKSFRVREKSSHRESDVLNCKASSSSSEKWTATRQNSSKVNVPRPRSSQKSVKQRGKKINWDERLNGFRAVRKFPLISITQDHFAALKLI